MKPDELKKIRTEMGARQKDLARVLSLPVRTYQNWEQAEDKVEHRKIPAELADRVRILAELKNKRGGTNYPEDLIWLQIPLRKKELDALKHKAIFADTSVSMLVRENILDLI